MGKVMAGAVAVAALAFVLAGGVWANAEKEQKVALNKLPKAVVDAVKARFPDAKLVSAEKEKENGKTVYEVNIKNKGKGVEVTVTPQGEIVLIETEIAGTDLPKAVADALESKYPRATLKKAEELAKGGAVTGYEVVIVTADNMRLEVTFDPSGKVLEVERQKGGKKKN